MSIRMTPTIEDYKRSCESLIADALRVPTMYFRTLSELETTMFGHAYAFTQLGVITRPKSFNVRFSHWLSQTKGVPDAMGWAYAVEQIESSAAARNRVLAELLAEFWGQWL